MRSKRPSVLLRDYVAHLSPSPSSLSDRTSGHEPRSFKEAMTDSGWRSAMQDEIHALENNHTWDMVPLPHDKK
ncbi:unnamed protein product, partial [Cuscuta epithymum]